MKNPQAFNQFQDLRKSNGNPQELLKQATNGYTPEQMKQFIQFANNMGISNEQLEHYGINSKS